MARKKNAAGLTTPNPDVVTRFQRRKAWFAMEWARQEANRYQMALEG